MKRNVLGKWLLVAAVCLLAESCQQLADDVLSANEKGTLKVKTRSAGSEEIVYPICLYAFSEEGDCAFSQVYEDEEESVELSLPEGEYRVVAMAGYSDDYDIPSKPKQEDEILLLGEGGAGTPLMLGKADVSVAADKERKLDLTLVYSVTSIDVALSNVPSEVEDVKVTLSSFYSTMDMDGKYVDSDYSLNLPCFLDDEDRWTSDTRYVFPGNGSQVTLSIVLTLEDEEEVTYSYVWKDTPEANQPYHLVGEYADGYALNGTFMVKGWKEAEEVKFDFGTTSSGDNETEGGEGDADTELSGVPEIGKIWNGCIVADVIETDESGTDVLLMSLDEWPSTVEQVDAVLSGYSVNGITGWRLPTHEEAAELKKNFMGDNRIELNEVIAEYDEKLYGLDEEERYLCTKNGEYYSFRFAPSTKISSAGNKVYYIRLVKTYRIEY